MTTDTENSGKAPLGFLAPLLPTSVAAYDILGSTSPSALYASEEEYIRRAVPARRREFATGRFCARQALAALGSSATPIPTGPHREPIWPAGVVGSITHAAGYCAAAVARSDVIATLGVDAEVAEPLPAEVLPIVTTSSERRHLDEMHFVNSDIPWSRLLFAAKEAVYKAWFPRTQQWLDFEDVEVVFSPERQVFTATLPGLPLPDEPDLTQINGNWVRMPQLLLAAVAIGCPKSPERFATQPTDSANQAPLGTGGPAR